MIDAVTHKGCYCLVN